MLSADYQVTQLSAWGVAMQAEDVMVKASDGCLLHLNETYDTLMDILDSNKTVPTFPVVSRPLAPGELGDFKGIISRARLVCMSKFSEAPWPSPKDPLDSPAQTSVGLQLQQLHTVTHVVLRFVHIKRHTATCIPYAISFCAMQHHGAACST